MSLVDARVDDLESRIREMRDMECILAGQLKSLDPSFLHVLEYEDMVANPGATAEALARFVGSDPAELSASFREGIRPSTKEHSPDVVAYGESLRIPTCRLPAALLQPPPPPPPPPRTRRRR